MRTCTGGRKVDLVVNYDGTLSLSSLSSSPLPDAMTVVNELTDDGIDRLGFNLFGDRNSNIRYTQFDQTCHMPIVHLNDDIPLSKLKIQNTLSHYLPVFGGDPPEDSLGNLYKVLSDLQALDKSMKNRRAEATSANPEFTWITWITGQFQGESDETATQRLLAEYPGVALPEKAISAWNDIIPSPFRAIPYKVARAVPLMYLPLTTPAPESTIDTSFNLRGHDLSNRIRIVLTVTDNKGHYAGDGYKLNQGALDFPPIPDGHAGPLVCDARYTYVPLESVRAKVEGVFEETYLITYTAAEFVPWWVWAYEKIGARDHSFVVSGGIEKLKERLDEIICAASAIAEVPLEPDVIPQEPSPQWLITSSSPSNSSIPSAGLRIFIVCIIVTLFLFGWCITWCLRRATYRRPVVAPSVSMAPPDSAGESDIRDEIASISSGQFAA